MSPVFLNTSLLLFVGAVALVDLGTHRIPNALTVTGAIAGLALNVWADGAPGVLTSVAGLVVGLCSFLLFYRAGGFGAGDVKAMAAVGAFVGAKGVLLAGAWTLVAGAVGALVLLIATGGFASLSTMMKRWMHRVLFAFATGTAPQIDPPAHDAAARRFPYGLAIACGTAISLAWM